MKAEQVKSDTDWAKLDAELKRKADMFKVYEEKRMAGREADQERREAERKAHEENVHKMVKEMMDDNQTKTGDNQE
jgi:hypothetical protein